METYGKNIAKASKQHLCDLCLISIPIGEVYSRRVIAMGGEKYTCKAHIHCETLLDLMCDDEDGITTDSFREYVESYIDNNLFINNAEMQSHILILKDKWDKKDKG